MERADATMFANEVLDILNSDRTPDQKLIQIEATARIYLISPGVTPPVGSEPPAASAEVANAATEGADAG
jgi:hypothetical protein